MRPHDPPTQSSYETFTALLVRAQPVVFGYVYSLTRRWDEAEEVMQVASVTGWKRFDQFRPGSNFTAWMCQIARLTALRHLRARRRDRHVFADELLDLLADEGEADTERFETEREAMAECLRQLPEGDRALLHECCSPASRINDVARRTGRSPNSLYKWLARTRLALLRCLDLRMRDWGMA